MLGALLRQVLGRSGRRPARDDAATSTAARAVSPMAENPDGLLAEAQTCVRRKAWDEAAALLERARDIAPENADVHRRLARVQCETGHHDDALDSYRLALHYEPASLESAVELCRLLVEQSMSIAAVDVLRAAIVHHPNSASLRAELGLRLTQTGDTVGAAGALDAAIACDAAYAPAWHNRGYLRLLLGDSQGALEDFEAAVKLAPDQIESRAGVAHALRDLGHLPQAIARYRKILDRHPSFEDARNNLALAQLLSGDFDRGYRNYEHRFGTGEAPPRGFPYPVWRGESLVGKRLLVYAEQGIGDEIMFASCLPDVLAQAAHVTVECSHRLAALFARSFPRATVHGARKTDSLEWLARLPAADVQVPVGSLPFHLRKRREAFPRHSGYLRADEARVGHWRSRWERLPGKLKVGISWRGGSLLSHGATRSMPWSVVRELLEVSQAAFVCLQHGDIEEALTDPLAARHLIVPQRITEDIDDLAALVRSLDLVVSVDNTNVHLCGALGVPVWVPLAHVPDWRYGASGPRMLWYPSATLYRQSGRNDWASVVAAVKRDLQQTIERMSR